MPSKHSVKFASRVSRTRDRRQWSWISVGCQQPDFQTIRKGKTFSRSRSRTGVRRCSCPGPWRRYAGLGSFGRWRGRQLVATGGRAANDLNTTVVISTTLSAISKRAVRTSSEVAKGLNLCETGRMERVRVWLKPVLSGKKWTGEYECSLCGELFRPSPIKPLDMALFFGLHIGTMHPGATIRHGHKHSSQPSEPILSWDSESE